MKGLSSGTRKLQEPKGKEDKINKDIRIMLIDDHELVRYGLRRMLEEEEDMDVVGDYANAEEAFSRIRMLSPDIVLMDTQMSGMNGIEATHSLKRNGLGYDVDVVMLAESADYRVEALKAGASGYLLKDITRAGLTQAIREVYRSKHLPDDHKGFVEETIELIVPPPTNAALLLRFMCQLEKRLHDSYNYVSIMHTVGSWDWGIVITILVWPTGLDSLLNELANMPEVEKVVEKPLARDAFSSFRKKFRVLPRLSISPSKRITVNLKETVMARQGLVGVLNQREG